MKVKKMYLSKSDYITFLKHPAWLWLKKNSSDFLPKPDENTKLIIDEGRLFEARAEKVFEDAIHLDRKDDEDIQELAAETKRLLDQNVGTVLQAAFIYGDYLCIADALTFTADGYVLTEIKATTSPDNEHYHDLSFQKVVIENSGIPIAKCQVLHANSEYIRHGEIKIDELVQITDVTAKVDKVITGTFENMNEAVKVMQLEIMPSDSLRYAGLGAAGEWREVFKKLHPEIQDYSIYDLASNKGRGMDKLIGELEDANIKMIVGIPETIKLQQHQKDQMKVTRLGIPIIDEDALSEFLDEVVFPIYFLDYESINRILPPFENTWPYEQVVFQHSIHIMQADGSLTHEGYLHDTNTNPAPKLIESLESIIGDTGTIIVWNQTFEKGRHKDLAKLYPIKAAFFEHLNDRVIDLEVPFKKRMYQDGRFKGRSSIKKVLPVLCPELSYKTLGIQEGGTASRSWYEAVVDESRDDKATVLANLTEYCGLDTYAMVEIYQKIQSLTSEVQSCLPIMDSPVVKEQKLASYN